MSETKFNVLTVHDRYSITRPPRTHCLCVIFPLTLK